MKSRRICSRLAVHCAALILVWMFTGSAMAAGPTETVLHNFTSQADGGYPVAGLILDQTGALYGTATIGGDYDACDQGGACGVVFKLTPPSNGGGWTESVLYEFQYQDPYPPSTNLVFDQLGNLYGGTGPGENGSAIFQLTESAGAWSMNPIYEPGGGTPIFDRKGNLYVFGGGTDGSVVELTQQPDGTWNPTTLYTFGGGQDGQYPQGGVVGDRAGNLYGVTLFGGGSTDCGIVFELSPQANGTWTESILHSFTGGSDGCYPYAAVILDLHGNLYGTTLSGGIGPCANQCGVVFELSPPSVSGAAWTESILHTFNSKDGANPQASLTMDSTGALYGTTAGGGNGPCEPTGSGCGTVFRLTPPSHPGGVWSEIFFSFQGLNGETPLANVLLDESKGVLYGTTRNGGTYGYGTAFQIAR